MLQFCVVALAAVLSASSATVQLNLSVILPFNGTSWCRGHEILPAIEMARDIINRDQLIRGYELVTTVYNGQCSTSGALHAFIETLLHSDNRTVGFIGPGCSGSAKPIGAASHHYPLISISYAAESSELSDSTVYPYFLRTAPDSRYLQNGLLALLKHFKWFRFALIAQNGYGGFSTDLFQQKVINDSQFNWSDVLLIPIAEGNNSWDPKSVVDELKKNGIKIVVALLFEQHARELVCEANSRGMTGCSGGEQHVWIFPGWYDREWWYRDSCGQTGDNSTGCQPDKIRMGIDGYLMIQNQYFTTEAGSAIIAGNLSVHDWKIEFHKRWQKRMYGREENKTVHIDNATYATYAYDAMFTWAYALNKSLEEGNELEFFNLNNKAASENFSKRLKQIMVNTMFNGISGEVKFDGNDRIANFSISNFVDGEYRAIGLYNIKTDKVQERPNVSVHWGHGCGSDTPRDRTPKVKEIHCPGLQPLASELESCAQAVAVVSSLGFVGVLVIIALLFFLYHRRFNATKQRMRALGLLDRKRRSVLLEIDNFEIPRTKLQLNRKLGEGCFGTVYGGEGIGIVAGEDRTPVAVKTLRPGAEAEEKLLFLEEVQVMKQLSHPHVVHLIGVCTKDEPVFVVMELMVYGDLKSYLLSHRQYLKSSDLQQFAVEICRAVDYMHSCQYVHRDIASRNCMITLNKTAKLGDFGLTRKIGESADYYRYQKIGLLPLRWMAPESIRNGIFTLSSDVWGFGVLLFEIITLAGFPYQGWSNYEVVENVPKGLTIDLPRQCNSDLSGVIHGCWNYEAADRPTMSNILASIDGVTRSEMFVPCTDVLPEIINAAKDAADTFPANTPLPVRKRIFPDDGARTKMIRRFSEATIGKQRVSQPTASSSLSDLNSTVPMPCVSSSPKATKNSCSSFYQETIIQYQETSA